MKSGPQANIGLGILKRGAAAWPEPTTSPSPSSPRRSVFRIHRDVRFSPDKSPYKTHASCWFFHRGAGRQVGQEADAGSAGCYFQISPTESFLGARGYAPGHPAEPWLRYQSFTLGRALSPDEALSPRLAAALERDFARLVPLVRWLNRALGYAPAKSR